MDHLINELRSNHIWIAHVLFEARMLGVDSERGYEKVMAAQKDLNKHFYSEEKYLFPFLRKQAANKKYVAELVRNYERDFVMITDMVNAFYARCTNRKTDRSDLNTELTMLYNLLVDKIWEVEEVLYIHYEMLTTEEAVTAFAT